MKNNRFLLFDLRTQQYLFTAAPLRTRTVARLVRREAERLTGTQGRIIVRPGPTHKKWKST